MGRGEVRVVAYAPAANLWYVSVAVLENAAKRVFAEGKTGVDTFSVCQPAT